MPLHDVLPSTGGNQTRVEATRGAYRDYGKGGSGMTAFTNIPKQVEELLQKSDVTIARRSFLKGAGMLVVSFGVAGSHPLVRAAMAQAGAAANAAGPYPDPDFHQLNSWIVIHEDNTATFYVGKTDCGQGTGTSFRQLMSDELDIAFDKTTCIMGSTDITVDQGGSGGSTAMERDSWPMRRVAAEARRVLLQMASEWFGVDVDQVAVSAGVVTVKSDPSKSVTYGQLIGGKKFNVTLTGSNINATTGRAAVKPVQELKNVGLSPQRYDIPAKVDGSLKWAVDMRLPGFVRVVTKGNSVAVLCEREEQAINAARALKVNWEKPVVAPFPSSENLFQYMREVKPTSSSKPSMVGDPDTVFANAPKVIEADYDVPFQGHTAISPAHAMA